jgi:integrase
MTEVFTGKLKDTAKTPLSALQPAIGKKGPKAGKPIDREYSDGGKLYLIATSAGDHRWIFKYRFGLPKKTRRMGLGMLNDVDLQTARRLAHGHRQTLAAGDDPMVGTRKKLHAAHATIMSIVEGPQRAKKLHPGMTFVEFAKYIRNVATSGMAPKSVVRWDRGMNVYAKELHKLVLGEITRHHVVACLAPIWTEIPVAAKKFQSQLHDLFERAAAAEVISDKVRNPADYGILKLILARQRNEEESHRALPYKLVPPLWQEMIKIDSLASWTAQFILLTLARTGEALSARKADIVLDGAEPCWHIPGKIMKNGKPANVPLSREAVALVQKVLAWHAKMEIESEYLFPGTDRHKQLDVTRTQSENTVLFFLQKQLKVDATTHGLRGTFRSWGGDQKGIEREVLEHCLHHILGDAAEMAYNKADQWEKRRETLQLWANHITGRSGAPSKKGKPDLKVVVA